jgi:transcriptional regulator with XRE-family HTH domain
MSQEEFAVRCGLHRTYIGSIERGEKTVTVETASKVATALELTLSELFRELEKSVDGKHADH